MTAAANKSELSAGARRLRSRIAQQFSSVDAEQLTAFASGLLAKGRSTYLEALGDDELMAVVGGSYRFFMGAGEIPRVRVFNPRLSTDGWEPDLTIVETCMENNPFVVDTVRGYLRREGLFIRYLLHPTLVTRRERDGGLLSVTAHGDDGVRESLVHVAIERRNDSAILPRIESDLRACMENLRLMMRDRHSMCGRLEAMAQDLEWIASVPGVCSRAAEANEAAAFLRWLAERNFVFIGYREARVEQGRDGPALEELPSGSLGICRPEESPVAAEPRGDAGPWVIGPTILKVGKVAVESPILPFSPMDEIGVQRLAPDERVIGEGRFLGQFTDRALSQESAELPVLRRVLDEILAAEGTFTESQDYNDIVTVFNGFPKEELFGAAPADILDDIRTVLSSEPGRVSVTARRTPRGQSGHRLSVTVGVPGGSLSVDQRERIQDVLVSHTGGKLVASGMNPGVGRLGCFHITLDSPGGCAAFADDQWKAEIAAIASTWSERLLVALEARYSPGEARRIAARFRDAFPPGYRMHADVCAAVSDVQRILQVERSGTPQVALANPGGPNQNRFTVLGIYRFDDGPVQGGFAPVLENLGLAVHAGNQVIVRLPEGSRFVLHTFDVQDRHGRRLDLERVRGRLEAAILAVNGGEIEDDRLNGLVLTTDLDWRDIDCLRTLCGYGFQIGLAPSRDALYDALLDNPTAARALVGVFFARFAPAGAGDPETAGAAFARCVEEVLKATDACILKDLGGIVEAIVRTSFFRPRGERRSYVAIKIDGTRLGGQPRPEREIYVQSARMEGLHLRSGRTARGSIVRLTSRSDLRAELLNLLMVQEVRAAPTILGAASAGFAVKGPTTVEASDNEIRAAHATLIRGLLDLTDNRVDGSVHRTQDEQIHEEEDPYLVLVPENAHAASSSLANEVAADYGFWLGDAFAAPAGLSGDDFNRRGIAAQGAWECVHAHLREAGHLVDDPIVVVGHGDMRDDFFAHGMLHSPSVHLRAALSRGYIFLDPNPDAGQAFAERERLARDHLGWEAYDSSKLGQGGMVVPRNAKRVQLSPEARAFLGVGEGELSGEAVTRAVLHAKADVLWSGGSGTNIQGDGESRPLARVGEGAALCDVEGPDLRAAIVAEGEPTGLSQRARVDFALTGGRINTSLIDGAGGLDLADHEVNLKILFQPLLESGMLSRLERDRLLGEVAGEVAARVLSRIRSQHRTLSFDQWRSQGLFAEYREAVAWLAADPTLAPALDVLPDRRGLRERRGRYLGLTRPELSMMLACSKNLLKRALLGAPTLLDDPVCEPFLFTCFPAPIRMQFADPIREHWLRRETVAAEVANRLVDTSGCTFIYRIVRDGDVDVCQAVRAWVLAFDIVDGHDLVDCLWSEGEGRSAFAGEASLQIQGTLVTALERLTRWFLCNATPHRRAGDFTAELESALGDARDQLPGCFSASEASIFRGRTAELEMAGLSAGLAHRLALLEWLDGALDVATIAAEAGAAWKEVALLFYGLSSWVDFPWLLGRIAESDDEDVWQRRAAQGLAEDLARVRRRFARRLCSMGATRAAPDALGIPPERVKKVAWLIADLKGSPRVSPAAVQVIVRELGRLCEVD